MHTNGPEGQLTTTPVFTGMSTDRLQKLETQVGWTDEELAELLAYYDALWALAQVLPVQFSLFRLAIYDRLSMFRNFTHSRRSAN